MKHLLFLVLLLVSVSCAQEKNLVSGDTEFQRTLNAEFKDATTSPLKAKDLKHFSGLDFFKFDSTFVVKATLKRSPNTEWFDMKTTTDRLSKERVFGVLHFELQGQSYQLNVYQGQELMEAADYKDYLFLPFMDHTNGSTSYAGGRYIDLKIPDGDTLVVDFNKAYNPYCAYDEKYSCPIVPRENYLDIEVEAGVKVFKK